MYPKFCQRLRIECSVVVVDFQINIQPTCYQLCVGAAAGYKIGNLTARSGEVRLTKKELKYCSAGGAKK